MSSYDSGRSCLGSEFWRTCGVGNELEDSVEISWFVGFVGADDRFLFTTYREKINKSFMHQLCHKMIDNDDIGFGNG